MRLFLLITALLRLPLQAGPKSPIHIYPVNDRDPAGQWSVDFTTGALWQAGHNTPLDYTILPQIISLRTPAHIRIPFGDNELTVRARLNLLAEAIPEGPESRYLGISFSPSVEYWNGGRDFCLYASAGGGLGAIDSRGVPGGQGQDLTFNWFAEAGVRYYFSPDWALHAGCMFQHWSNLGLTDPNPGVDAVGPVVGLTWHF